MSTSSNSDNNNMLDKGLSSNICESMKARLIPSSPPSGGGGTSSPPSLSSSPPSTDPENNLNKRSSEKGLMYFDKPVLNIDDQNYTINTPPAAYPNRGVNNSSPDQVLVNVTSPQAHLHLGYNTNNACVPGDIRRSAVTCRCRAKSPVSSSNNPFLLSSPGPTTTTSPTSTSPVATTHTLSSLFPLVECRTCFHKECAPYCNSHHCKRLPPDSLQGPKPLPQDVPLAEWSAGNVVDWMAALNLSSYTELFKSKDIKGADLISLDEEKLGNMGIKDEFHQQSILVCINQLQGEGLLGGRDTDPSLMEAFTTPSSFHNLVPQSFNTLHKCDKCKQYLRGFVHQGQYCKDCDAILHRTCAATGMKPCVPSPVNRIVLSHVFGLSLCKQKMINESQVPLLLVRCCDELLRRARNSSTLDIYRLYRKTTPQEELNRLREACDRAYPDMYEVNLDHYEAETIAYLVKRYLQELPDPVIPERWHDNFVNTARTVHSEDECLKHFAQYLTEFPTHHYDTLKFLMTHFLQLCELQVSKGKKEPPTILIRSICHVIMRPPWDKIIELASNTEANMRVLEVLLRRMDWGVPVPTFDTAPVPPPRLPYPTNIQSPTSPHLPDISPLPPVPLPSTSASDSTPRCLQEAEWYWGAISRDQVNILMKDAQDGTFIVRDASTGNNEYTLTLRKGGTNKLIKIFHSNGKYGFTEPLEFNSVVELINYCCRKSLSKFNKTLDIRLLYPVCKYAVYKENESSNVDEVQQKLHETHRDLYDKQTRHDLFQSQQEDLSRRLNSTRHSMDTYEEIVEWMKAHLNLHDKFLEEAQPHEKKDLEDNRNVIRERLQRVTGAYTSYNKQLVIEEEENNEIERQLFSLKGELSRLNNSRTEFISILTEKGIPIVKFEMEFENTQQIKPPTQEMYNEKTWLFDVCSRDDATRMLTGKPKGTFLIRTRQPGSYALSISCSNEVQHCLIYKSVRGYGFAEPYLIYSSLMELVVHYSHASLIIHNDLLNTSLTYPVKSVSIPTNATS